MIVSQPGTRSEGARSMLIVTESVDGTGKTTIAHSLQSALNKDCGGSVVHVSFPTQTCKDSYVSNLF